ncbi:hypothetical protein F5Y18DRAFT_437897 [Xylariaceae sp. FL1019]|nr:hypothetical protein F5Y18DRAFT_437897 [Xylariaceae sp. FL1019]
MPDHKLITVLILHQIATGATFFSVAPSGAFVLLLTRGMSHCLLMACCGGTGSLGVEPLSLLNAIPKPACVEHPLIRIYLETFFNYCPINDNNLYLTGSNNDGYGLLWSVVYGRMYRHMRTWQPSLVGLETRILTRHVPARFADVYQRFMQGVPFYRSQWDASNIEYEHNGLLRWRNNRAELKRALLRLSYTRYEQLVEHNAPNVQDAFDVALLAFFFFSFCRFLTLYIAYYWDEQPSGNSVLGICRMSSYMGYEEVALN